MSDRGKVAGIGAGEHGLVTESRTAPEWELAPQGFRTKLSGATGGGWDVQAVADSYRRKWLEFIRSIDGAGPLGVQHEVPDGVPMTREDPIAQNIVLSYAHALSTAAGQQGKLTILDWGGATGHYYELGRRLVQTELDYHCRELPAVCEVGRELVPAVTFHDTDECLDRTYDFVLASNSLQYEEDWSRRLELLAAAAGPWLFLSRVPITDAHPSFVVLQRAHRYGYDTQYLGWVLNRAELIEATERGGLDVIREYAQVPEMAIESAPDNPRQIGLLLRRSDDTPERRSQVDQ